MEGSSAVHIPLPVGGQTQECHTVQWMRGTPLLEEILPPPTRIFLLSAEGWAAGLEHWVCPGLRAHCSCTQGCSHRAWSSRGCKNHSQAAMGGSLPKHPSRGNCKFRAEFYFTSAIPSLHFTVWPPELWGVWGKATGSVGGSGAIQAWTPARKHMHSPPDGGYCRNREETFSLISQ